jgi:membrane-bound serine protease (ClpP class)
MDPFALNLIMIIGFVVGSGLIILEAFIPGFGVAGISGVVLEVIALRCCWLLHGTVPTLLSLLGVLLLIGLAVFFSYRSAMNGRLSKSHLVLKSTETAAEDKSRPAEWIGREGVTVTALRPAGQIEIEGIRLNAASAGDFIEKGVPVLVTGLEGDHYVIRRKA